MAFLEVDDIKTYYGNIQALKGVSLEVNEGECVTLIGSNGRQVDHAALDLRPHAAARGRSGSPATRSSTCRRRRSSGSASASRRRAASASSA